MSSRSLVCEMNLDDVAVSGDPAQLRIVVDNLISNAVKFSPAGGRIRVSLGESGGQATLDVCDEGPGISAADRNRIFEPFYQGEAQSVGPLKGTGLGLAIASDYVNAHQGSIEGVDAQCGAHLRVWLPARPAAALRTTA